MSIEDIKIKIKKYDREKQVVIGNITIAEIFEVRGFRARFGRTKYSPSAPVWIVSPPSVKIGKNYFWIFELQDKELWQQLSDEFIRQAKEYTNTYI